MDSSLGIAKLGRAGITVASLGYKSTDSEGLVRKLAVDAKAARHCGTGGGGAGGAALAQQAQLERSQLPPCIISVALKHAILGWPNGYGLISSGW